MEEFYIISKVVKETAIVLISLLTKHQSQWGPWKSESTGPSVLVTTKAGPDLRPALARFGLRSRGLYTTRTKGSNETSLDPRKAQIPAHGKKRGLCGDVDVHSDCMGRIMSLYRHDFPYILFVFCVLKSLVMWSPRGRPRHAYIVTDVSIGNHPQTLQISTHTVGLSALTQAELGRPRSLHSFWHDCMTFPTPLLPKDAIGSVTARFYNSKELKLWLSFPNHPSVFFFLFFLVFFFIGFL